MARFLLVFISLLLPANWPCNSIFQAAEASKSKPAKPSVTSGSRQTRPSIKNSSRSPKRKTILSKDTRLSRVSSAPKGSTKGKTKPIDFISVAQVRSEVVSVYQRAAAGRIVAPVRHLTDRHGQGLLSPESAAGLTELEDDVLDIFRIPPARRNRMWKEIEAAFLEKYDLNEQAWLTVYGYYAEQVFGTDAKIVGKRQDKIRTHIESLRRSLSLTEPRTLTERRYLYYLSNLRRKSTPEMAEDLGTSQARVYADFTVLGLSREAAFSEIPSASQRFRIVQYLARENTHIEGCEDDCAMSFLQLAKQLHEKNWSRKKISIALSLGGSEALIYFLVPNGVPRGSDWTEKIDLGDDFVAEEEALLQLNSRGLNSREIALLINRAKGITDRTSDGYRTQRQVQSKLNELGIRSQKKSQYPRNHKIEKYGRVKANGVLNVDAAKRYIYDHVHSQSLTEIAARLAVSPTALRHFIAKWHLPSPSSTPGSESEAKQVEQRIANAVKQYKSGAPLVLPEALRRTKRTPAKSLANAIARMIHHGKMPPKIRKRAAQMSPEEKKDTAAGQFIRTHKWTQEEVDALPEVPQRIVKPIFERQQRGQRGKRTSAESLANAIARMTLHGKMPSKPKKLVAQMTPEEKKDSAAADYIRGHKWTKSEVDELPVVPRKIVQPIFERQQNGERLQRTPAESRANAIARINHHGTMPPVRQIPVAKMTPEEINDRDAYYYVRSRNWKQAEIESLPPKTRGIVTSFLKKRNESLRAKKAQ